MLPAGAKPILDARLSGKCPADPVAVNLTNKFCTYEPWVKANPSKAYEWEWAAGLDLVVFAESTNPTVRDMIEEIGRQVIGLRVYFTDLDMGWDVSVLPDNITTEKHIPKSGWRWSIHHEPLSVDELEQLKQFTTESFR